MKKLWKQPDNWLTWKESCREAAALGLPDGPSSGCSVYAALQIARKLGKGNRVLCICADTGERYLQTDLWDYELDWELPEHKDGPLDWEALFQETRE